MSAPHKPVLFQAVLEGLRLQPDSNIIDCTVGAGGHSYGILQQNGPAGQILGLDVDPTALKIAKNRLTPFGERVQLAQANFDNVTAAAEEHRFQPVHGILADLGVSSMQIDTPERGFSFAHDGPLDMRMGEDGESAADLVNTLDEQDLANIIYRYGEERKSRRIAKAIVSQRPFDTTAKLAKTVSRAMGGRRGQKIHPATRTFQAIRIAVNDELGALERFLPQAISLLVPGGRLAVISFHSLEDRIVKQFFQQEAKDCLCPPKQLMCICGHKATIDIITRKPLIATEAEIEENARARSAKLRIVEKRKI